jgi:hypothetical protein
MPEPMVSALMAAYNAEPFIAEAIESALAQDWPADRLEVVVVDDGSTDGTAEVVERYLGTGRVRLIRQANAGPCGAVNAALTVACGEWLALLDADDAWPRDKLRVQGAVLESRPEVGLVYGDMRVVDEHGDVIQESWLEGEPLIPEGRCVAELLAGNPATASSILMRASVVEPIPAEIPYTDWWFAARAALVSEIAYVAEPRTLYRFHGGNITLGVKGPNKLRELRKAMTLVRWFLRRLDEASPAGLAAAWTFFEHCGREIRQLTGSPFAPLVEVSEADSAEARAVLARASSPVEFARAAALDPGCVEAVEGLQAALAAALDGGGERFVLAHADELLENPRLLSAWTAARVPGATLAVLTPPELTEALVGAVPDEVDAVAIGSHAQLPAVHALLSEQGRDEPAAPRFGAAQLGRLAAAWT